LGASCAAGSKLEVHNHCGYPSSTLGRHNILTCPAQFKCFAPPVKLSEDELGRLREFAGLSPSPVISGSSAVSLVSPGGGDARRSLALQALYANTAVKTALSDNLAIFIGPDEDEDDDDDDWEDNMDPITFSRYYAAANPLMAQIVQDHDRKMRERLDQGIAAWVKGIPSGYSLWGPLG